MWTGAQVKTFLACLVGGIGIAAAIYFGVVFMLVGGVVCIVHGFQQSPVNAGTVAWGFVRLIFWEVAVLFAWLGLILAALIADKPKKRFTPQKRKRI